MRTPFPQSRINEIIAEVEVAQIAAEDAAMLEKMAGLRCMSCECPLPPPADGSRRCARCEGWGR
jgi:hypothetical protein